MKHYRVNRLVIKPTLKCTANCAGCASRRDLHHSLSREDQLSLGQWQSVLEDASKIGLKNLHISGGEPTLYPDLIGLIEVGKQLGLRIRLNSNGSMIRRETAEELLKAGLDEICISIYSHKPEIHNSFCKSIDLWQKATRAVRLLASFREKYPKFLLGTMSIILRENFRSFAELVKFHHELGSQQMGISYLEGDFSGRYLLNKAEILEFKHLVVPRLLEYCRRLDPRIRSRAMNVVRDLYGKSLGDMDALSLGRYWRRGYCDVPKTAGLIMANGDVHPCNIVEYTHKPVMGNLLKNSFQEIWHSDKWDRYRKTLHQRCLYCPVNIYTPLPLDNSIDSGLLVSLFHSRAFSPFRPAAKMIREFYRGQKHKL